MFGALKHVASVLSGSGSVNQRVESVQKFTISDALISARERPVKKFKSVGQAQKFLGTHEASYNIFNMGRHLVRAELFRNFRKSVS